jgi:predicted adenine nucleotide alpha hydrolase (AANH) superfamily ATPase
LTNFKSGLILIIKALLSTTLKKSEANLMEKESEHGKPLSRRREKKEQLKALASKVRTDKTSLDRKSIEMSKVLYRINQRWLGCFFETEASMALLIFFN